MLRRFGGCLYRKGVAIQVIPTFFAKLKSLLPCPEAAKRTNYSEDKGLKVRFSIATIVFETFGLILCQMLSSQGKNAPSNPLSSLFTALSNLKVMPPLLIGCFPGDFQEGKRPIKALGETAH